MIKMKDLIEKQNNMIRRQTGMKLVTEKKDLNPRFIKDIAKMTDSNNHLLARFQLAKYLGNDKLSLTHSSNMTQK